MASRETTKVRTKSIDWKEIYPNHTAAKLDTKRTVWTMSEEGEPIQRVTESAAVRNAVSFLTGMERVYIKSTVIQGLLHTSSIHRMPYVSILNRCVLERYIPNRSAKI